MRVTLTHPFCWPYVRRGTERNVDVWYRYLQGRGYDVRMVSTYPADAAPSAGNSSKILYSPNWSPLLGKIRIQPFHTFFFTAYRALRELDSDVVHCFHFYDALAAGLARNRGRRYRTVMQMNGVPVPGVSCHRLFPPEAAMIRSAMRRADCRIACSAFVQEMIRTHYGVDSLVIAPPLDMDLWPVGEGPRADPPAVLAVANFNEPRKGIRVLIGAFQLLRRELPDVRLWLSGSLSPTVEAEVLAPLTPQVRAGISVLGLGGTEDLPGLYQQASVLALPSMWEPSGTVMMEAWMCGTPVAVTRHGGLPEFFAEGTGVMFDPRTEAEETHNAAGLAEALHRGILLSRLPDTRMRCRRHGEAFSTQVAGPRIENVYKDLTHATG